MRMGKMDLNKITPVGKYKIAKGTSNAPHGYIPLKTKLVDEKPIKGSDKVYKIFRADL